MTVTVVVIEDEPAMRDLIVGYLTRRGNRVAGCGTLAEAAQALRVLQPDVVVSDVGLPDGNGATQRNSARSHSRYNFLGCYPVPNRFTPRAARDGQSIGRELLDAQLRRRARGAGVLAP